MTSKKILIWVSFFILLSLLVFVLTFVKTPYTITSWAKVVPAKQWFLMRGPDGELISKLVNNFSAVNEEYSVNQIVRGEKSTYSFNKGILNKRFIQMGDTIGTLYSSATEADYLKLQGELNLAKAQLKVLLKGAKTAVISEAEQRLNFSKAKAERHKILLDRLAKLNRDTLVSAEEYEMARAKMDQLEYEVKIAESQLDIVKSGEKIEEIELAQSNIEKLISEIAVIENKIASYLIKSPIEGILSKTYGSDTLITISEIDDFVLLIPLDLNESVYFLNGAKLSYGNSTKIVEDIEVEPEISSEVKILNGRQVRLATLSVKDSAEILLSGMMMQVELSGQHISLIDYLSEYLN